MNDNAVSPKEASVREHVSSQGAIISKINEMLDDFLANTLQDNRKDGCDNPTKSVGCFMDELEDNGLRLKSAYSKLEIILRTFYG